MQGIISYSYIRLNADRNTFAAVILDYLDDSSIELQANSFQPIHHCNHHHYLCSPVFCKNGCSNIDEPADRGTIPIALLH